MNKDQRNAVVEYISTLSDEDIRFISVRLSERFFGDLAEALNAMSKSLRMDTVLQENQSAFELYDMLEKIRDLMTKDCKRRGLTLKSGPNAV